MKKILLSMLFVGVASLANAQKSEISEAKKQWTILALAQNKPLADNLKILNEGLAHTDKAIVHEKSKGIAEAWSYRALIASRIALIDSVDMQNSLAKQKIADEAIAKAKELDPKGEEKANIDNAVYNVDNAVRNRGIIAFNKQDFATAFENFTEVTRRTPNDTAMYINAGIAAKSLKKYPEMISNFKKGIELNYADPKVLYSEMVNVTFDELKDTVAGLALLKEASAKLPEDSYFIGLETDLYIKKGDIAKSQEMLKKLMDKDPKNPTFHFLMGETYFKQALNVQTERNNLDTKKVKESAALATKITTLIDQSIPFYKAAVALDPKHENSLESLKTIYAFKDDKVNFEAVKKQLEEIKK
ncbi:tetratricopeptide repeat protein [Pedobacter metabolipauper]|uniref:Tetratricopeptide repeat protein n=1 Tax=Pedobacter metabolipauper TaxID=425513 RepID=A0A4V3D1M1_9SPHI|nr:tetratricopeptide repeat protein [Pedobacter metabolipauper]TDQ11683.1 tetratricopeptide repeat protein [Pedobacter metabolipauper]